jgi:hypothetical protein
MILVWYCINTRTLCDVGEIVTKHDPIDFDSVHFSAAATWLVMDGPHG